MLLLRAVLALWSVWLQFAILDPGSFDPCPEHSHHAAAAPAMDHGSHAAHAHHSHGKPSDHTAHKCSCLGACCCTPSLVPASHAAPVPTPAVVAVAAPRYVVSPAFVARAPHALPFANGPPASPKLSA